MLYYVNTIIVYGVTSWGKHWSGWNYEV